MHLTGNILIKTCLCHRLNSCGSYLLKERWFSNGGVGARLITCPHPTRVQSRNLGILIKASRTNFAMANSDNSTYCCKLKDKRVLKMKSLGCAYFPKACSSVGTRVPESNITESSPIEMNQESNVTSREASLLGLPQAERLEELQNKYKRLKNAKTNRFVFRPELAELIVDKVWPDGSLSEEKALIIETSPGPGILTRQLLNSGASRLLCMERDKTFIPSLGGFASKSHGRLTVMHADFYAMHYHSNRTIHPPVVQAATVFEGMQPVPWEADIPIKIIGSLPHTNERTHAYVLASQLLERLSSFKYGRVQFNVLMSEGCYSVISQPVGNMFKYRALSALMQISCDIELLHKEPQASFRLLSTKGDTTNSILNDKETPLCLVRLTPKRDLFINHQLSQQHAFIFVYFVRQVLARRKQRLAKMIEAWAPGHEEIIKDFGYNHQTLTGNVAPTDLLRIYMVISRLDSFNGSWMGEDMVDYGSRALESEEGVDSIASRGIQH